VVRLAADLRAGVFVSLGMCDPFLGVVDGRSFLGKAADSYSAKTIKRRRFHS